MKLTLKDIISIAIVAIVSMPILYFAMLFLTGNARIEFGPKIDEDEKKKIETIKRSARKDSIAVVQSHAFIAAKAAHDSVLRERERLRKHQEHIELLQQQLEETRQQLTAEREKLEKLMKQASELDKSRIAQLAKVYGSMRAAEAAQILETLDDELVIKILVAINDDRQKAKIVSALSTAKAARISRKIGLTIVKEEMAPQKQ